MSTYIVVVDDEPDVESMFRQQFRRDLKSGRFLMEFALSAPAALEQVKAIPDPSLILILSDVNMPGMTGLEMLPKVKAERPNVPVIMVTAYGDEATKESGRTRSGRIASQVNLANVFTLPNELRAGPVRRKSPATTANIPVFGRLRAETGSSTIAWRGLQCKFVNCSSSAIVKLGILR